MTPLMKCDEIVQAFNAVTERKHWKARISGRREDPTVSFSSRVHMVALAYSPRTLKWTVTFTKLSCAFGDFMAGTYNAMTQICQSLKASGHEIEAPLDATDGVLRLEYNPSGKETSVRLAKLTDDWTAFDDDPFKVHENNLL